MIITTQQMEKLLLGQFLFKHWAFSMLITQLKNKYAVEPTEATLEKCTNELNSFITKYKAILGQDMAIIQGI